MSRLLILSRAGAQSYEPTGNEVCISITNPYDEPVRLSSGFTDVLRLRFSDIAKPSAMDFDILFAPEDARAIVDFVAKWRDADRIVVHCVAGLSRSPAVAMAICDLEGWPTDALESAYPLWNTWVRSMLVRVGGSCR